MKNSFFHCVFNPRNSILAQQSLHYSATKSLYFRGCWKYKAPLPVKVGCKSGEVALGKAWAIPAHHLLSTESDIFWEHSPNTERSVHGEKSCCYTGGKEKLSHVLWCMGGVVVCEIIYRLYDKLGAFSSIWAEFQFCHDS